MASQSNNTIAYFANRTKAAQFASDTIQSLPLDLPLTMIIRPVRSEGYYVTIATEESLDDIVMPNFFGE
jgi:hypothetical protein